MRPDRATADPASADDDLACDVRDSHRRLLLDRAADEEPVPWLALPPSPVSGGWVIR